MLYNHSGAIPLISQKPLWPEPQGALSTRTRRHGGERGTPPAAPNSKENIMRKFLPWAVAALLALTLAGCQKLVPDEANPSKTLYASFPPVYALSAPIVSGAPGITIKCPGAAPGRLPEKLRAERLGRGAACKRGRGDPGGPRPGVLRKRSFGGESSRSWGAMDGLTLLNNGSVAAEGDEPDHFEDENPWAFLSVAQGAGNVLHHHRGHDRVGPGL